jgi:hypothetical protein
MKLFENDEFDLTILFEEDDVVMNASDPLMSHTFDQDNSNAHTFSCCKQTMVNGLHSSSGVSRGCWRQ